MILILLLPSYVPVFPAVPLVGILCHSSRGGFDANIHMVCDSALAADGSRVVLYRGETPSKNGRNQEQHLFIIILLHIVLK